MSAALEKKRRAHADAVAELEREKRSGEQRGPAAREFARREALEELIRELRVEERTRVRQSNSIFSAKRIIVHEERLCLRDRPLSNWVEQETVGEEDTEEAPKPQPVFLLTGPSARSGVNHNLRVTSS